MNICKRILPVLFLLVFIQLTVAAKTINVRSESVQLIDQHKNTGKIYKSLPDNTHLYNRTARIEQDPNPVKKKAKAKKHKIQIFINIGENTGEVLIGILEIVIDVLSDM